MDEGERSRTMRDMGRDRIEDIVPHHDTAAVIRETPHVAHGKVADANTLKIVR
jgi:hypothetical protein